MHVIQGWNGNTFVGMPQKTNMQKGQKERKVIESGRSIDEILEVLSQ